MGGAGEFVPNWAADVLAEAVAQVHATGGRVAVRAVGPAAVDAAVAAGVNSVEHGWAVTDAHFAAMRARNIAWVPTLMPGGSDAACEFAAAMGFSTRTREWMRATLDAPAGNGGAGGCRRRDEVLAGTDAGQGPHGVIVDQITMLADAGVPVTAAISARLVDRTPLGSAWPVSNRALPPIWSCTTRTRVSTWFCR